MFNVGPEKLMVVLLVALIVLGPDKLPNAARQIGRYLNDFRRISQGFQQELRSAIDMAADPVTSFTQPVPGESGPSAQPATPVDPEPDLEPGAEATTDDPRPASDPGTAEAEQTVDPAPTAAAEPAPSSGESEPTGEPAAEPVVMPVAETSHETLPEPVAEPVAEPNRTASA
jgi:sec-independent protein translocase protein TatB